MDYNTLNSKMKNAMSHFEKELASIRTSRASTSMLDNIMVDAYNSKTPISQLANINVPDSSTLTIQDEGNELTTAATTLNFTGNGITASGTGTTKTINVSNSGDSAGIEILDTQTVTSNVQNVDLAVGSNHADYEYFSLAFIDELGTLNGYMVWQPVNTSDSLHGTSTHSKWQ